MGGRCGFLPVTSIADRRFVNRLKNCGTGFPADVAVWQALNMNAADIARAASKLRGVVHRTPVLTCSRLNLAVGAELFFKAEHLQKTGSFKARGASYAVSLLSAEERHRGVVTHSSGNHAAALAWAALAQGVQARVVMPEDSLPNKIDAVRSYGADVTLCPPTIAARAQSLEKIVAATGAVFIPPFDDERIIAGQGTAALEFLDEVPDLDLIIVPVGGGGLLSGTILAVGGRVPVYGAEPSLADDAWRSLKAGVIAEPVDPPRSIADGLRTGLGKLTWPIIRDGVEDILLVEDGAIIPATRDLMRFGKWLVEPSGAVPLAALLAHADRFKGRRIGVILSGGNADVGQFLS